MAGAGAKLFASGDVLTAAQVNTYLMDQSVMRFADATARTNAFGGAGEPVLAEGMLSYLDSDNTVYVYDGSAWKAVGVASTIDAKGDLLVGTADNTVGKLPVGINSYRVTAASGESTGLKYDMPSIPVFADNTARDNAFGGAGEKTLADGQVCYVEAAPKKLMIYNGTSWIPYDINATAYTPTLTNVTLGNGGINGVYQRIGNYVLAGVHLSFGSTTSVTGLIGIGLPFTVASGANSRVLPIVGLGDTGTSTFWGVGVIAESASRADIYAQSTSGSYSTVAGTSATVPHTWANTDEIYFSCVYRYI